PCRRRVTRRLVMQKARRHSTRLLRPLVGTRFQVLFHSPSGVLCTFPSRYLSAIGHQGVLSLGGWSPQIRTAFHGCGPTQGHASRGRQLSPTGLLPAVVPVFHGSSASRRLSDSRQAGHDLDSTPYNPRRKTRVRLHPPGLGWIPFRSPLLGESRLISFPRGTEMFQFPRLPSSRLCIQRGITPYYHSWVSPFGNPGVNGYSAPNRGLSQPFTPFFDSWCQGIHHVPFLS